MSRKKPNTQYARGDIYNVDNKGSMEHVGPVIYGRAEEEAKPKPAADTPDPLDRKIKEAKFKKDNADAWKSKGEAWKTWLILIAGLVLLVLVLLGIIDKSDAGEAAGLLGG